MLKKTLLNIAVFSFLCVGFFATGCASPEKPSVDIAVKNVDIFDSRNATILENKTILIRGDRIEAIVDSSETVSSAETIDGLGRLVVPGFIDTHAHLMQVLRASPEATPETLKVITSEDRTNLTEQYLQYGTTTLADLGMAEEWLPEAIRWRDDPSTDYPNLIIAGGSLISNTGEPEPIHFIKLDGEAAIRYKVQEYAALGLRHLKLYRKLTAGDMKIVIDEADKFDMTMLAHTDNGVVTIPQALDMGVIHFEHFFTLVPSTIPFREEMGSLMQSLDLQGINSVDEYAAIMTFFFDYINENKERHESLLSILDQMAAAGVSLSTTINVHASAANRTEFYCSLDPVPDKTEPELSYTTAQKEKLDQSFDVMMAYVKAAHDKGVSIRIGTDCWYGGYALLSELQLLLEAGFSMEDVLQIATWNGAKALGVEDEIGHLSVGMKADFILFEQNPFEDTKGLFGEKDVFKSGKLFVAD